MKTRLSLHSTIFLITILVSGCGGPKIKSFTVQPLITCGHEAVRLDWEVKGEPHLEVRFDPARDTPTTGQLTNVPADTLTFLLVAKHRGKEAPREVAVLQIPPQFERDVVFRTALDTDGEIFATGVIEEKWDNFSIGSLLSASDRMIIVEHAGVRDTLSSDGTPSNVHAGLPLTGEWTLRTDKSLPLPDRLRVRAEIRCQH
jgi:hypothetical protein